MTKTNQTKWSLFLGIPVALAAITTIFTFVSNKNFRCYIAHVVGIESSYCVDKSNLYTVNLYILTDKGDALKGAEVQLIGYDTPETQYTDKDGFVKAQIASTGDIKVRVKAKDYPIEDVTINLNTTQNITREIRLSQTSKPIVITPSDSRNTPTIPQSNPAIPQNTPAIAQDTPTIPQNTPTISILPMTVVQGSVTWELKSCTGKQSIVSCDFLLTSTQDVTYNVYLDNSTKIVDGSNNEYYASKVNVGKKSAGANNKLDFNMVKDARSNVTIEFKEIPSSISQAFLLQIHAYGYGVVQFRNVPIKHS